MSSQKEHVVLPSERRCCIPPENLSAALDGEYSFTHSELAHLKQCSRCRELYESYKLLDDVVSRTLDVECPGGFTQRLRKKVSYYTGRESTLPEEEKKGFDFIAWSLRAAAMLTLLGAALFLIWKEYRPSQVPGKALYANVPLSRPSEDQTLSQGLKRSFSGAVTSRTLQGSVDIRDLNLISGGNSPVLEFVDSASALPKKYGASRVETIPGEVQHVWIIDPALKASGSEKIFREALKKSKVPLSSSKLDLSSDGTLRAVLELTRYQCVMLVRALAAEKCMLVNSSQPQPEQRLFAGSGRELVKYHLLLIPRGK